MSATRDEILNELRQWVSAAEFVELTDVMDAYRADVLREAADALDESPRLRDFTDDHMSDVNEAANELRRMAAEGEAKPCG